MARCAPTKAMPELNNTKVLTSGSIVGLSVSISLIPTGGQMPPIEIAGDKLP
jgi:hypothetical protein